MKSLDTTSGPDLSSWPRGAQAFMAVLLLTIAFWHTDHAFFWRDDWNFLSGMRSFSTGYLFSDHFGHVMPLTKLFYYLELVLFGPDADSFALVNLLVMAVTAYMVLLILLRLTTSTAAWSTTIILAVHPLLFNHVGWTFEQCISWHLLFQVLAVGAFLGWTNSGTSRDLGLTILFTLLQNYSFGNGIFLPAFFAVAAFFWKERTKVRTQGAGAFLLLFVLFLLVQLRFGGDRASGPSSANDFLGILTGGIHLLGIDTARWFFVMDHVLGRTLPILGTLLFLALVVIALLRKDRDRGLALFHTGWFLVSFCSVPLVRRASLMDLPIPHYYSILCLVPAAFIVEHALGGRSWWSIVPQKLMLTGAVGLLILVFLLDRQLMAMISFRSFRNEQAMMHSLQDGTPYKGFDEPYFRADKDKVEDPLGIYRYWRERDHFRLPIGYAHEPSNWTRTTPLSEQ